MALFSPKATREHALLLQYSLGTMHHTSRTNLLLLSASGQGRYKPSPQYAGLMCSKHQLRQRALVTAPSVNVPLLTQAGATQPSRKLSSSSAPFLAAPGHHESPVRFLARSNQVTIKVLSSKLPPDHHESTVPVIIRCHHESFLDASLPFLSYSVHLGPP